MQAPTTTSNQRPQKTVFGRMFCYCCESPSQDIWPTPSLLQAVSHSVLHEHVVQVCGRLNLPQFIAVPTHVKAHNIHCASSCQPPAASLSGRMRQNCSSTAGTAALQKEPHRRKKMHYRASTRPEEVCAHSGYAIHLPPAGNAAKRYEVAVDVQSALGMHLAHHNSCEALACNCPPLSPSCCCCCCTLTKASSAAIAKPS